MFRAIQSIVRNTRKHLLLSAVLLLFACQSGDDPQPVIPFTPIDLHEFSSNLHGFNLLGKYDINWSNAGFQEEDFIIINDLGFNFARLAVDYLTYTSTADWTSFIENEVAEIDQAIEWGQQHGVHICLDLHRVPGYSVNPSNIPPSHQANLWTSPAAQDAFVKHWEFFAQRYRDIPNSDLSFNLLNEPTNVDETTYVTIMKKAIDKIHQINPNRVIFVDGLDYSTKLLLSLKGKQNIIQSMHMYDPHTLTHYKASWVEGADQYPVPQWPMLDISRYLFGTWQAAYQSPLILNGTFEAGTEITVNVHQVSNQSTMVWSIDNAPFYTKDFVCGPDLGDDWTEIVNTQWGYQNISNKDYTATLPAGGLQLTLENTNGDWIRINRITIHDDAGDIVITPSDNSWAIPQEAYTIQDNGSIVDAAGNAPVLRNIRTRYQEAADQNIPIMIQEFGVYNYAAHDVSIAYLNDVVPIFRDFNIGFALWGLYGPFGIIDSERDDCPYEPYRGHELDRQMLEILE
jgi:hypothetical protein